MLAVGLRFKQIRETKGLSQEIALFNTGLNIGTIEPGETNLSLTTMGILCKYLDISLEELFKGVELE